MVKKSLWLLVCSSVLGISALGQTVTLSSVTSSLGNQSAGPLAATADFNGDGYPDVAILSPTQSGTGALHVLISDGSGSYSTYLLNTGNTALQVLPADINGDGRPDLVVANALSNSVDVFWNNGGGFDSSQKSTISGIFTGNAQPSRLAVTDVYLDGNKDIFVGDNVSTRVNWYRYVKATDTFLLSGNFNYSALSSSATVNMTTGDFDGDGCPDVAVAARSSIIIYSCRGYQVGGFNYGGGTDAIGIAAGDFDGDGKVDLAVTASNGTLHFLKNTSNGNMGNFSFNSSVWAPVTLPGYAYAIAAGDLNRDGLSDLAIIVYSAPGLITFTSNGDGTFAQTTLNVALNSETIALGDFNRDGLLDVLAPGNNSQAQIFQNTSPVLKAPRRATIFAGLGETAPSLSLAVGTFAGGSTTFSSGLTYLPINTPGFLTATPTTATSSSSSNVTLAVNASSVAASGGLNPGNYTAKAAFTASGYAGTSTNVTLKAGRPAGALGTPSSISIPSNFRSVATGDFNGDGRLDFVLYGNQLSVMLNNGSGGFTLVNSTGYGGASNVLLPGDFNGDGKLDFVSFNADNARIEIYLGDGAGNLQYLDVQAVSGLPTTIPGLTISLGDPYPTGITGDFNNDGRTDIALRIGGVVTLLLNSGHGYFLQGPSSVVFTGNYYPYPANLFEGSPAGMVAGDFNGDGNLDIALAGPSRVSVVYGDGFGGLGQTVQAYGPNGSDLFRAHFIGAGDVNGDGVDDLIIGQPAAFSVSLGGSGFPSRNPATITIPGSTNFAANILDINGDGKADLVFGNNNGRTISNISYTGDIIVALGDGNGGFPTISTTPVVSDGGCNTPNSIFPADYNGDGRMDLLFLNSNSGCSSIYLALGALTSSSSVLSLNGNGSAPYGSAAPVFLNVTANGAFGNPTGFAALYKSDGTALATTNRPTGGPWTFTGVPAGTYTNANAVYSGDSRFNSSTSNNVTFTVTRATGSLVLAAPTASTFNQSANFTATLTPASSTGTVTFKDGTTVLGTGILQSPGVWTYSTTSLSVGSHSITAVLTGDSNVTDTTSVAITQVVNKDTATVNFTNLTQAYTGTGKQPTATTFPVGKSFVLTYTSGACPSSANPVNSGPAAVGVYCATATINDPSYTGSGSATFTITKGAATIDITGTSQNFDGSPKPVTVTTTPANLSYSITYAGGTTVPSALGQYAVVVTITDPNYTGTANATLDIQTTPATTTSISSPQNPSTYGDALTWTVTVSGNSGFAKTGSVTVYVDGVQNQVLTQNGATNILALGFTLNLPGGSHAVSAIYNADHADANNASSTSNTVNQVVNKRSTTVSLTNLTQTYTGNGLSATATSPAGAVQIDLTYNGGTTLPVNAGTYALGATINDTNYTGSATGTFTIAKASGAISYTGLTSSYDGNSHSVGAVPTPNVPVTVTYVPLAGGTPTSTPPTAAGTYTVNATNSNYAFPTGSMVIGKQIVSLTLGNLSQTVNPGGTASPVTVLTNPAGISFSVKYDDYSNPATVNPPTLSQGTFFNFRVVASVTDPNYVGSTTGVLGLHTRSATTLNVISSANPTYSTTTVLTANLGYSYVGGGAKATGLVTFYEGATFLGTGTLNTSGIATVRTGFAPGSHTVYATYAGDVDNGPSTSANWTFTVAKGKLTLALVPGQVTSYIYDKTAKSLTWANPYNLKINVTYNGSATLPVNAGTYNVAAVVDSSEPNFTSDVATATLTITQAAATVTLGSLNQAFVANSPRSATATTSPANLPVNFTYSQNGSPATPTNVGSYAVTATINDPNYTGQATGTLVITGATAQITISNTNQNWDGSPKTVTVTTVPANLAYTVTYNGGTFAPTDAGNYPVVVTITDPNFTASTSGTLTINGKVTFTLSAFTSSVGLISMDGAPANGPTFVAPGRHTISCFGDPGDSYSRSVFYSWSDNGAATHEIVVSGTPQSYTCRVDLEFHDIVTPSTGGTVTGDGFYARGSIWNAVAVPAPGYMFNSWSYSLAGTAARQTTTVNPLPLTAGSTSFLQANFTPAYQVNVNVSPAGAGSVTGGGIYPLSTPTFTVAASTNGGYKFDHWSVTGANVVIPPGATGPQVAGLLNQPTQSFTQASSLITVVANYVPLLPVLNLSIGARGTDLGSGFRYATFNIANTGNGTAANVRITGVNILAIQSPLDSVTPCVVVVAGATGNAAVAALIAAASGGRCPVSFPTPRVVPDAGYIPATFGNIAAGGKNSAVIYFDWSTFATKVVMDVTYTRDGGTPQTTTITTLR